MTKDTLLWRILLLETFARRGVVAKQALADELHLLALEVEHHLDVA